MLSITRNSHAWGPDIRILDARVNRVLFYNILGSDERIRIIEVKTQFFPFLYIFSCLPQAVVTENMNG
jgi:hypothetical protein